MAVTLGMLAAMGVYGLSATSYDVRAAGHTRLAAQSQHSGELAVVMSSSILASSNAETVNAAMRSLPSSSRPTAKCATAKPQSATDLEALKTNNAEACWSYRLEDLKPFSATPSSFPSSTGTEFPFATGNPFGDVTALPYIRVEVTNPVEWEAPSGNMISSAANSRAPIFRQLRLTVFSEMRRKIGSNLQAADAVSLWRGRIVVGPF